MKHLVLLVVLTVIGLLAALFIRLGAGKDVTITVEDRAASQVIFKPHLGEYHKVVPVLLEVEKWAKENKLGCKLTFGEYFDDPDTVSEDRLRSRAGCILETGPPMVLPKDFAVGSLPEGKYAVAVFEGAPSLGPIKVYPKVFDYLEEKNLKHAGSIIEIYEILSDQAVRTTYLFPITSEQAAPADGSAGGS